MRIGIIVALLLAAGAFAQERDFLTADEVIKSGMFKNLISG